MSSAAVDFACVHGFSTFDKHYVASPQDFSSFIQAVPSFDSLKEQVAIKDSNYSYSRRKLVEVIANQYDRINCLDKDTRSKLKVLASPDTFTIITAHQPSLLTGSLYFIHKIISAIVTAEAAEKIMPDKRILPVFIIGGEDHDFEEMNHLYYRNDRYEWQNSHTEGAVGRMSTEGIAKTIQQLKPSLSQSFYGKEISDLLEKSFTGEQSVADGMHFFLHSLFQQESLLVVQMDDLHFKEAFAPYILQEILQEKSKSAVERTQQELQSMGYGNQALARDINFFYLFQGRRNRIHHTEGKYIILETDISFTPDEMEREIRSHPDRFSPNVIMRPVYQEFIFPNLGYVGGGGELAYWMERKRQFEKFDLAFPLLIRRHSASILLESSKKKLSNFSLELCHWMSPIHEVENTWLDQHFSSDLDLSEAFKKLHMAFDQLRNKIEGIDESLLYSNEAARVDSLKPLNRLEKKIRRSIKKKEKHQRQLLQALHAELYPEGNLQERHTNFLEFYARRGPKLFGDLKDAFQPLKPELSIISIP